MGPGASVGASFGEGDGGIGQSPPSHKHSALLQLPSHIPSSIQPKLHVQSTYLCAAGGEQQSTSSERNTGRHIHDLTMGEGCVSAIAGRAGSWPRAVLTCYWLRFPFGIDFRFKVTAINNKARP